MAYKSKFTGKQVEERLEHMFNVTYDELKTMRDNSQLIPGHMYRMTDYETTCTWENTQIAGHPFDLVLTALDNKTLDEKCSAIWSERDTDGYFANSNLPAWDVRYCLDNDTERFDWAQMGGSVLKVSAEGLELEVFKTGLIVEFDGATHYVWEARMEGEQPVPLLSRTSEPKVGDELILSVDGETILMTLQVVDSYEKAGGKGVIYRLIDESENSVPYDFKNIMFMRPLTDGKYDAENGVDTFCYTFCCIDKDTYAIEDQSVKEPSSCCNNKFGVHSYDNVFLTRSGKGCSFSTFGNDCYSNTFGDDCDRNLFYQNCSNIVFVSDRTDNSIPYYSEIILEGDNSYITITNTQTNYFQRFIKHIKVCCGVGGNSSSPIEIDYTHLNEKQQMTVAFKSTGQVKIYCEADLAN